MSPKEKAEDLIDKYIQFLPYHSKDSNLKRAVGSALIAVQEILNANPHGNPLNSDGYSTTVYWQEVKEEINNLNIKKQ